MLPGKVVLIIIRFRTRLTARGRAGGAEKDSTRENLANYKGREGANSEEKTKRGGETFI